MSEWVLFQLPPDLQLSSLDGKKISMKLEGLQEVGNLKVLMTNAASDHVLPLKEKKGKLKVAGNFRKSVQVIKSK